MNSDSIRRRPLFLYIVLLAALTAAAGGFMLEARIFGLLKNSLLLSAGTLAISLPVGGSLAWFVFRTNLPCRGWIGAALASLLIVPLYVQAAAWNAGFGQLGWLPTISGVTGRQLANGWVASIWTHAMYAIPWVFVIVGMGVRSLERDWEESALLDANWRQVFWRISLPRLAPSLGAASIWVMVQTLGEMTISDLYALRTLSEEIYLDYAMNVQGGTPFAMGWEASVSTSLGWMTPVVLTLLLVASISLLVDYFAPLTNVVDRPCLEIPLCWSRWWVFAAVMIVCLVTIGMPLSNLIFKLGHHVTNVDGITRQTWSGEVAWHNLVSAPRKHSLEFWWTISTSTMSGSIALALAWPAAWIARTRTWGRWVAIMFIGFGLGIPGPAIGIVVIWLFNQSHVPGMIYLYDNTVLPLAIAGAVRPTALMVLVLWQALSKLTPETLEQSSADGASPWQQLIHIGIRPLMLTTAGAWLLACLVSAGDLSAGILVAPPAIDPIQRLVFGYIHAGVDDQVASICLFQLVIIIPLAWIAWRFVSSKAHRSESF
jgi:iron(III) transport system permease protein